MVDEPLPSGGERHPLRYIFLDLNAYFASVEQEVDPALRGRPVGVGPPDMPSGTIIAASYEAKAFGVKTGTKVGEARELCPDLVVVDPRHTLYTHYHKRILEAVETVLPVDRVCSIDEMQFRLLTSEAPREVAMTLARRLKAAIREHAGETLRCSVGIAPNAFLAKLGTELQKPDGLVVLEQRDLPHALHVLKLTDFTGINKRMSVRLRAADIFTAEQLCAASRKELGRAFGSIVGEKWWYLLRGYDLPTEQTKTRSLSHSHVLPPRLRTDQGCREVLLRLIQKAAARLRASNWCAGAMDINVRALGRGWQTHRRFSGTSDTVFFNERFLEMWAERDFERPLAVGVVFSDLMPPEAVTPSLFDGPEQRTGLNQAVDDINHRYGKNTVYLAGLHHAKDTAPERIAFQKTELFKEGAGDNEWKLNP